MRLAPTCWWLVRILLDESLPRPLAGALIGHDVSTVQEESWTSLSNGALLRQAAATFDVVMTADRNIEFQQNLTTLPVAIVVLVTDSNLLESLEPLIPEILEFAQDFDSEDSRARGCLETLLGRLQT